MEDHMVASQLMGPSFQEVVLDQVVLIQVEEASCQEAVVGEENEIFQGVIHQAVKLEPAKVPELGAVALEGVAQESFLASPGLL